MCHEKTERINKEHLKEIDVNSNVAKNILKSTNWWENPATGGSTCAKPWKALYGGLVRQAHDCLCYIPAFGESEQGRSKHSTREMQGLLLPEFTLY